MPLLRRAPLLLRWSRAGTSRSLPRPARSFWQRFAKIGHLDQFALFRLVPGHNLPVGRPCWIFSSKFRRCCDGGAASGRAFFIGRRSGASVSLELLLEGGELLLLPGVVELLLERLQDLLLVT